MIKCVKPKGYEYFWKALVMCECHHSCRFGIKSAVELKSCTGTSLIDRHIIKKRLLHSNRCIVYSRRLSLSSQLLNKNLQMVFCCSCTLYSVEDDKRVKVAEQHSDFYLFVCVCLHVCVCASSGSREGEPQEEGDGGEDQESQAGEGES